MHILALKEAVRFSYIYSALFSIDTLAIKKCLSLIR